MRNWLRTTLFISAFSPALITLAYVRYEIQGWQTDVAQLLIIGVIGASLPLLIIFAIRSEGEVFCIQAKKIESNDFMLFAFVGSYLLPFILKGTDLSVNAIAGALLFAGLILWLVSSLPAHPILRIFKFKFYKLESSSGMVYMLISKRELRDPKEVKMVKRISSTMLMEA